MKVAVFGGTGAIGGETVEDLVFRGYEVTTLVPDRARVPATWSNRVKVVSGSLSDAAAVDAAVAGGQAVINALDPRSAPRSRQLDLVEATGHIVAAMHHHGIRRYIGHGTPVVSLCPKEKPTAHIRAHRLAAQYFHRHVYQQLRGMVQVVTGADLDWTIVRYMHVTSRPGRGLRYVGYFGPGGAGSSATAVDIAHFTVSQVLATSHICDAPAVSN